MQFSAADKQHERAKGGATLNIRASWSAAALPSELQIMNIDEWLATLALLVDDEAVQISRLNVAEIQLTFV